MEKFRRNDLGYHELFYLWSIDLADGLGAAESEIDHDELDLFWERDSNCVASDAISICCSCGKLSCLLLKGIRSGAMLTALQ